MVNGLREIWRGQEVANRLIWSEQLVRCEWEQRSNGFRVDAKLAFIEATSLPMGKLAVTIR